MAAVNGLAEGEWEEGKQDTKARASLFRLARTENRMSAFTVTEEACHGGGNTNQDVTFKNKWTEVLAGTTDILRWKQCCHLQSSRSRTMYQAALIATLRCGACGLRAAEWTELEAFW